MVGRAVCLLFGSDLIGEIVSVYVLLCITPGMVVTMQLVARRVAPFLGNASEMALRAREQITCAQRAQTKFWVAPSPTPQEGSGRLL